MTSNLELSLTRLPRAVAAGALLSVALLSGEAVAQRSAQGPEPAHRQVVLLTRVRAQGFDDGRGNGEGRLPKAELEDLSAPRN